MYLQEEPPVIKEVNTSRQQPSILQDEEKSQLLQKLLQSKNPQDLQAANRLIKSMVKEVAFSSLLYPGMMCAFIHNIKCCRFSR